ncbi:MAG: hypothetical protein FK733_17405 [Asgard group archaeon]|nr:hypothetical protein [Asgard group archaeon]
METRRDIFSYNGKYTILSIISAFSVTLIFASFNQTFKIFNTPLLVDGEYFASGTLSMFLLGNWYSQPTGSQLGDPYTWGDSSYFSSLGVQYPSIIQFYVVFGSIALILGFILCFISILFFIRERSLLKLIIILPAAMITIGGIFLFIGLHTFSNYAAQIMDLVGKTDHHNYMSVSFNSLKASFMAYSCIGLLFILLPILLHLTKFSDQFVLDRNHYISRLDENMNLKKRNYILSKVMIFVALGVFLCYEIYNLGIIAHQIRIVRSYFTLETLLRLHRLFDIGSILYVISLSLVIVLLVLGSQRSSLYEGTKTSKNVFRDLAPIILILIFVIPRIFYEIQNIQYSMSIYPDDSLIVGVHYYSEYSRTWFTISIDRILIDIFTKFFYLIFAFLFAKDFIYKNTNKRFKFTRSFLVTIPLLFTFSLSVIHPILYGSFQNRIAAGPSIIGEFTFGLQYFRMVLFPATLIIVLVFLIISVQIRIKFNPLKNRDTDKLDIVTTNELTNK